MVMAVRSLVSVLRSRLRMAVLGQTHAARPARLGQVEYVERAPDRDAAEQHLIAMARGCGGTPQARAARMLPRQALEPHYLGAANELLPLGFPSGLAGG